MNEFVNGLVEIIKYREKVGNWIDESLEEIKNDLYKLLDNEYNRQVNVKFIMENQNFILQVRFLQDFRESLNFQIVFTINEVLRVINNKYNNQIKMENVTDIDVKDALGKIIISQLIN